MEEKGWCRSQVLWVGMGLEATVAEDSRDPGGEAALPGLSTGWERSLDPAGVGEGIWLLARVQPWALGPTDGGSNPSTAAFDPQITSESHFRHLQKRDNCPFKRRQQQRARLDFLGSNPSSATYQACDLEAISVTCLSLYLVEVVVPTGRIAVRIQ